MDNKLKHDLATLSGLTYEAPNVGTKFSVRIPPGYTLIGERTSIPLGSNAASFYNNSTNTLVTGSAGNNVKNPIDLLQNIGVVFTEWTGQVYTSMALRDESLATLAQAGITKPNIIYTGHSQGGVTSQQLVLQDPNFWVLKLGLYETLGGNYVVRT